MQFKLRTKLTLAFLVPVLVMFLGTGWLAYRGFRQGLEQELGRRLSSIAQSISVQFMETRDAERLVRLVPDPESLVRQRFNERLVRYRDTTQVRRVFIVSPDLIGLLDTDPEGVVGAERFDLEADRTEIGSLSQGESRGTHSVLFTDADGTRYMNGYAPIHLDGELVAVVGVEGSASFYSALDSLRTALAVLMVLVGFLVVGVSVFFSHRLTQPVGRLVDAIRRYGRGDLKEPVQVHSRDEIGFLAEAFNDMRVSLDRRDEQMQLMLSGIAHEVRNPLAGMELFCSLMKDEVKDQPLLEEYVDKISRELDYLSRVVTDFLKFARRRPLVPERFEARELIMEVVEGRGSDAQKRGVSIEVDLDGEVELTGEREALRGACANLLQNAIQACQDGGAVHLRCRARGGWRFLEVEDTGHGIPEEKLKLIFEPFYTTRQQGTGLGLALVHKTVQEHGGDIKVQSEVGKGTRFTIELPFDEALKPLVHQPEYEGGRDEVEMIG